MASGDLQDSVAVATLAQFVAFSGPCAQRIRVSAVHVVSGLSSSAAVRLLVRTAVTDPSTVVRDAAFAALGRIRAASAVDGLDSVATHSTDPYTRERAITALSARPEPAARAVLARLEQRDLLSAEGRRTLPVQPRPALSSAERNSLLRWQNRVKDKAVRAQISAVLADSTPTSARELLIGFVLNDAEPIVEREMAINAVRSALSAQRTMALFDQLEGIPSLQVYLIARMATMGDATANDRLVQIARTGPSSIVGKLAATALALAGDPRAPALLVDLVRNPVDALK